jgi:hypothetical protein
MAVTKTILRNTNLETIVQVSGTAASATITLNSDILASSQSLTSGGTPTVDITGYMVSGLLTSAITVTRNSVNQMTFAPENSGTFDFQGQGFAQTQNNTSDIVVTIAGAEATLILKLRKQTGYSPKVETAQFGGGDNPAAVGS